MGILKLARQCIDLTRLVCSLSCSRQSPGLFAIVFQTVAWSVHYIVFQTVAWSVRYRVPDSRLVRLLYRVRLFCSLSRVQHVFVILAVQEHARLSDDGQWTRYSRT